MEFNLSEEQAMLRDSVRAMAKQEILPFAAAIDEALNDHELIKVRLRGLERDQRKPVIAEICADLDAESVALVGGVATFFRKRPEN